VEAVGGVGGLVEVGRGGDGVVYRGWQEAARRWVAVKVFDAGRAGGAADGLVHPRIVRVLDRGVTSAGRGYLVMEWYGGGSLHDLVRESGPLPVGVVLDAGAAVADALAYAHAVGVVHGDVTPGNVLSDGESFVLADFGAGAGRFSYRHAAPSILDGAAAGPADDVYALGSTLFTALTGRPPYAGERGDDSALGYLRRVRTGQRRAFRRNGVPAVLVALVERCLATDGAQRPAAAQLRELPAWAPRQLPPAPPDTDGLSVHLGRMADAAGAVLLTGPSAPALAVHFGHSYAARFPDGQLYADLGRGDPLPRFLRALGVPPDRVPTDADEREALYRTALAGRRVLVVLDNARAAGQVRPLLPGTGGCLAVVTAPAPLPGLNAGLVLPL
jgi:serine/threonine protein kinase